MANVDCAMCKGHNRCKRCTTNFAWPMTLVIGGHTFPEVHMPLLMFYHWPTSCRPADAHTSCLCVNAMSNAACRWPKLVARCKLVTDKVSCHRPTPMSYSRCTHTTSEAYIPWLIPMQCATSLARYHMPRIMCGLLGALDSVTHILTKRSRHHFYRDL